MFISYNSSITCVTQGDAPNDDVVSCIVLLSSLDSDCPLYVHSYRDVDFHAIVVQGRVKERELSLVREDPFGLCIGCYKLVD